MGAPDRRARARRPPPGTARRRPLWARIGPRAAAGAARVVSRARARCTARRITRRALALGMLAAVVVPVALAALPAPARAATGADARVGRVLLISLPYVDWSDVVHADLPNL